MFAIYGTTYGAGDGVSTFNLPDFRNRAIWGADGFGYIEAGLPNITGRLSTGQRNWATVVATGSFYESGYDGNTANDGNGSAKAVNFDASRSNSIYGKSNTVQPNAIKVRVITRYR